MSITVAEYRKLTRKPRKYRNSPLRIGELRFDSKAEANRYQDLRLLEQARTITGLKLQPRFALNVNGVHVCDYISDFEFYENGRRIVEDVKGYRTRDFIIKKKLMLAVFGIEVRETRLSKS